MRVKLVIEYDGTNYAGWQRQKNGITVQEVLEQAFCKASGERAVIHGAGRTDAGVHAEAQVAHLDTNCTIPANKISYAMNMLLPPDIRVKQSAEAGKDFHARFSAKAKTYRYTYYNDTHASAIYRNTTTHVHGRIDIRAMKIAAEYIRGTHDFACFCASGSDVTDTVRTVYRLAVTSDEPFIHIDVTGSGFLYNMVRIIAGTLIDVGQKKVSPEHVKDVICGRDRTKASATAPARGLTLKEIHYTPFGKDKDIDA
ncbi:MAG: tRNA pseudouridine(38-40) synthase TruA [Eubacteriales bacterium]|nr:tRNA pseudouridine(38-40) synthase TruA [Eubacteriales bacterium]